MRAIEYVSYSDAIGYGTAAVGYVRLLVEAGFPVHWTPFPYDDVASGRLGPGSLARGRSALVARGAEGADSRLRRFVEATSRPVDAPVRILHLIPAYWRGLMSPATGVRHIGMTTFETDRLPSAWLEPLARVDHLCVPCAHNLALLAASPRRLPAATVVPHVCREPLAPPPPARLEPLAKHLGVGPDDIVFYAINAWAPRKRLAPLIDGFVRSFRAEDGVILVVKTSRLVAFDDPASPIADRNAARVAAAIVERAAAALGRPPPRVAVLADEDLADNVIDGLHELGHCFVSLSRSEGFGLGAFDAAAHGRPVIAVGYGGLVDYLGETWRGRAPHRMAPADNASGYEWFESAEHFWPEPDDAAAFALMRAFAADPAPYRAEAAALSINIREAFGARAVTERLISALDAVG